MRKCLRGVFSTPRLLPGQWPAAWQHSAQRASAIHQRTASEGSSRILHCLEHSHEPRARTAGAPRADRGQRPAAPARCCGRCCARVRIGRLGPREVPCYEMKMEKVRAKADGLRRSSDLISSATATLHRALANATNATDVVSIESTPEAGMPASFVHGFVDSVAYRRTDCWRARLGTEPRRQRSGWPEYVTELRKRCTW